MLKYVCSKLLNAVRYDKVYLARADAKDKAQQVSPAFVISTMSCMKHDHIGED
jgi:hypothetical protein